jgi:hypothetical protein
MVGYWHFTPNWSAAPVLLAGRLAKRNFSLPNCCRAGFTSSHGLPPSRPKYWHITPKRNDRQTGLITSFATGMRFIVALCLVVISLTNVSASAESENEPAKDQMDVIARATAALSSSRVAELTSRFNHPENTGYYLRDISFIGRYPTRVGSRLLFRTTFIRSSPYQPDAGAPLRGHSFLVVLDDKFTVLGYQGIEIDSTITFSAGKVRSEEALLFDFNSTK